MNTVIALAIIALLFTSLLALVSVSSKPSWRKPCECGLNERGYCHAVMYKGSMSGILKCNKYRRNSGLSELD